MIGGPCGVCGRSMRVRRHSTAASPPGTVPHRGRGLCASCHERARLAGTLTDHPLTLRRWTDYADDYVMLRADGYPLLVIADRLGMTFDALDRALVRHADDPRARRPAGRCVA